MNRAMKGRIVTAADGSALYVTADGDMVDAIAHGYFGKHERNTEAILEANPDLAEYGPVLPAGTVVKLPRIMQQETPKPFRQLWN